MGYYIRWCRQGQDSNIAGGKQVTFHEQPLTPDLSIPCTKDDSVLYIASARSIARRF